MAASEFASPPKPERHLRCDGFSHRSGRYPLIGDTHAGYEVYTSEVDPASLPVLPPARRGMTVALTQSVANAEPDALVSVLIRTLTPAAEPFPLLPVVSAVSAEDYALALEEQDELAISAASSYATATNALVDAIEAVGQGARWSAAEAHRQVVKAGALKGETSRGHPTTDLGATQACRRTRAARPL